MSNSVDMISYKTELNVVSFLIGSGLDPDKHEILDKLLPGDFSCKHNARIWKAMREIVATGGELNTITVGQYLNDRNVEYGGFDWLCEVAKLDPDFFSIDGYVDTLSGLAYRRQMIEKSQALIDLARCESDVDILSDAIGETLKLTDKVTANGVPLISHYGKQWLDDFERRLMLNGEPDGVQTGFDNIDSIYHGIKPGWLVVIAGRPSMGKTYFAQTIAEHISFNRKESVGFFSMEMSGVELFQRSIIKHSNLNKDWIKDPSLVPEDKQNFFWGKVSNAQAKIVNSKLHLCDKSGLSVQQIVSKIKWMKKKDPELRAVFIDYLGLIKKEKAERNDIAIGNIMSKLKAAARSLEVTVFLLAQGNRATDQTSRPSMSNLKDSSDIEATADLVWFVHREEVGNPETELKGIMEVISAKDRHEGFYGSYFFDMTTPNLTSLDAKVIGQRMQEIEKKKAEQRAEEKKLSQQKGLKRGR